MTTLLAIVLIWLLCNALLLACLGLERSEALSQRVKGNFRAAIGRRVV